MPTVKKKRTFWRIIRYGLAFLIFVLIFFLVLVNRYLEPVLKDRIHTIIVQGSDSLYKYNLGRLHANFFGGNVEVENLQVWVDSGRYHLLRDQNALPSLTMQLNLVKGQIKGVALLPLLFGKRIIIKQIISKDADVKLSRHLHKEDESKEEAVPLWKALQPAIKSISIGKINLDGIKLLYKDADTIEAVKLQFDKCVALFDNIRIDSAAASDTSRIGFTKKIAMRFESLKFRTADSIYKMKADVINYSSANRTLEVKQFKMQPTLKGDDFYRSLKHQESMYTILFDDVTFTNCRLDRFVHSNIISADSILFKKPDVTIYNDRTWPIVIESKIGKSPQQRLLNTGPVIIVKGIAMHNAKVQYTEKNDKTQQEGSLVLDNLNISIANVTNYQKLIDQNPLCVAKMQGTILNSPIAATFNFYLNSQDGKFDASGTVKNANAAQLNPLAEPLGNVKLQSFNLSQLTFKVSGDDFSATGNVHMLYNNLNLQLQKQNQETGAITTRKFLTKIVNRYTLWPANPGSDGVERTADNIMVARVSSKSFFGLVWQTVFTGMQRIMYRTGRYE